MRWENIEVLMFTSNAPGSSPTPVSQSFTNHKPTYGYILQTARISQAARQLIESLHQPTDEASLKKALRGLYLVAARQLPEEDLRSADWWRGLLEQKMP